MQEKERTICTRNVWGTFWQAAAVWLSFAAWLLLSTVLTAEAAGVQKVVDEAGLLYADEAETLEEQLSRIADTYGYDALILTVDSCYGMSTRQFAEEYYLEHGYGFGEESDGIMLLVSMGERQYYFATFGNATDIFTAYGLERMDDIVSADLSDGEYYEAFVSFAELTDQFIRAGENGKPYDIDHEYKEQMSIGMRLLIAGGIGLLIAAAVLAGLFGQLRSVGTQLLAQEYVREGSFRVTRSRDIFLYRTISRIRKEKPPNGGGGGGATHHTSAGGRAGGRGGSF